MRVERHKDRQTRRHREAEREEEWPIRVKMGDRSMDQPTHGWTGKGHLFLLPLYVAGLSTSAFHGGLGC